MPNFTSSAIKTAFLKLIDEKPLNRITVKDIVEECGINRNSFYYHFQDIPTLIEEIVIEEADRIIDEYPIIDSLEDGLNAAVEFAGQNRRALLHIYKSVSRDIFEQYLWRVCEHIVTAYSKTLTNNDKLDEIDRGLILHFLKCECFGLVIDWMNNGMKDDVHTKIARTGELFRDMTDKFRK